MAGFQSHPPNKKAKDEKPKTAALSPELPEPLARRSRRRSRRRSKLFGSSAARRQAEQAQATAWSKLCGTGVEASMVASLARRSLGARSALARLSGAFSFPQSEPTSEANEGAKEKAEIWVVVALFCFFFLRGGGVVERCVFWFVSFGAGRER